MNRVPRNALILLTKNPVPGNCKTRMTPELTPGQVAELYRAFIRDLIEKCKSQADFSFYVYLLDPDPEQGDFWESLQVEPTAQQGTDLGERMHRAFMDCFDKDFARVVLVGSDVPMIPVQRIREAFEMLHEVEVVLGPSEDGGYYLIGLTEGNRALFENMAWGTGTVFDRTLRVIHRLNLKAAVIEKENDIDTYQDLQRLILETQKADKHHFPQEAPQSYALLKKIFEK